MSRSAWLTNRGELARFFDYPANRRTIIDFWNASVTPQIVQYFGDGSAFVGYFEGRVGDRVKLLQVMRQHGVLVPDGAAMKEMHEEARRLCGAPDLSWTTEPAAECRSSTLRAVPEAAPLPPMRQPPAPPVAPPAAAASSFDERTVEEQRRLLAQYAAKPASPAAINDDDDDDDKKCCVCLVGPRQYAFVHQQSSDAHRCICGGCLEKKVQWPTCPLCAMPTAGAPLRIY